MAHLAARLPIQMYTVVPNEWKETSELDVIELEEKNLANGRRIRLFRLLSHFVSLFLETFMIGSLSYSLAKFYFTKNKLIASGGHPWPMDTVVWPTFMLLVISIFTFLTNFIGICSYMCGRRAADITNSWVSKIGYVVTAGHVIMWVVATGLFKMANSGRDLWGYSCSSHADAIQDEVKSYMNFGMLCTVQTGSWYTSIIEAVKYVITFFVMILTLRQASHKKKLERARSDRLIDREFVQSSEP